MNTAVSDKSIFQSAGVSLVILASGDSVRFGSPKLLYPLAGKKTIEYILDTVRAGRMEETAVVSTRSEEVRQLAEDRGINCAYHDGPYLSDSIRAGLAAAGKKAGYMFLQADQPLITLTSLEGMIKLWLEDPAYVIRAGFGGQAAAPVLFPASLYDDLYSLEGNKGGSSILREKNIPCRIFQVRYGYELKDLDTPDDIRYFEDMIRENSRKGTDRHDNLQSL